MRLGGLTAAALIAAALIPIPLAQPADATSHASPTGHRFGRDEIVARISAYGGVVWGKVNVSYRLNGKTVRLRTCTRRTCKYWPPHGVVMTLIAHPRAKRVWRFRSWIVHNGGYLSHAYSKTLTMRIRSHIFNNVNEFKARVKANFYYP
jgi:hypothetical protein